MPDRTAMVNPLSFSSIRDIHSDTRPPSSEPNLVEDPGLDMSTGWQPSSPQVTRPATSNSTPTRPRSLAGIKVEAEEVDELFKLYLHVG